MSPASSPRHRRRNQGRRPRSHSAGNLSKVGSHARAYTAGPDKVATFIGEDAARTGSEARVGVLATIEMRKTIRARLFLS